jgi:hypothetical protein
VSDLKLGHNQARKSNEYETILSLKYDSKRFLKAPVHVKHTFEGLAAVGAELFFFLLHRKPAPQRATMSRPNQSLPCTALSHVAKNANLKIAIASETKQLRVSRRSKRLAYSRTWNGFPQFGHCKCNRHRFVRHKK